MPTLDIVIVNWNSGRQLEECLESIRRASVASLCLRSVVVVDNGSSDGSVKDGVASGLPLRLLVNRENRGFAAACNQGARGCTSDLLLFLNPDAALLPDSLAGPVTFITGPDAADIGIVGVRLVGENGAVATSCARFPSAATFVAEALGLSRLFPRSVRGLFMTDFDHSSRAIVDHVSGAFYLIRRTLFEELGGFDERFFVYLEDLDLSFRARGAGWLTLFAPEWTVMHRGGGVSRAVPAARLFYALRSRLLYAFKHLPRARAWLVVVATLGVEPAVRTFRSLARGRLAELTSTVEAYGRLLPEIRRLVSKGLDAADT